MAILRCTQKLLSELKLKPFETKELLSDLNSCHANLLRIDRRKCVLFTHDTTLYSFFGPGLLMRDLRAMKFGYVEDKGPEKINAMYFKNRKDGLRTCWTQTAGI